MHRPVCLVTARAISIAGLAFGTSLLASPAFGDSIRLHKIFRDPKVIHEFYRDRDFQSQNPLLGATVDRNGVAWMATSNELFRVVNGKPTLVDAAGVSDRRLAIAPGGGRYVWMTNSTGTFGRFTVELLALANPRKAISRLEIGGRPRAFSTLHIGGQGRLFVSVEPLQDLEGRRGDFRYEFWSGSGAFQDVVPLAGPRLGVVDERSESILLMGRADSSAHRKDGLLLWSVKDHYRKGVIAARGAIALLNPARAVKEVHVIRSGAVTKVSMTDPVHELAITPDGSYAAVATGAGKLSFIDLQNCLGTGCPLVHSQRLPVMGKHYITALRFIDRATVVLGVIRSMDGGPRRHFDDASVVVITTSGHVKFQRAIPLAKPATWSPSLDVTFGSPKFAAFTPRAAMFVDVGT